MERALTQEERIRRAEEIYLRRRNVKPQYRETREFTKNKQVPIGKSSIRLFKKMGLQIVICLLLYCIFYLIYDTNYSFSDTTISKTEEILNYDINFNEIYNYFSEKIMSFINKEENIEDDNNNEENTNNVEDNNNEEQTNEVSVINNIVPEEQNIPQEPVEETQQTSSTEPNLRQLYPLILPVKRRIYNIRIWSKRINF